MEKTRNKCISLILIVALAVFPGTPVMAQYTSIAPDAADIAITNNAGTSDVIYVTNLYGGETIKVYNASTAGKQIGSGKCASTKTEASFTITQLGKTSGVVYISITGAGELESARTAVAYDGEIQSDALDQEQVTVTNYSGKADLIYVSGLYGGETIKVYDAATGGKQLGTVKVSESSTEGTIKVTQLGVSGGTIYVTQTSSCELESPRLAAAFAAEGQSTAPLTDNITIVNNAGTSDTIRINNLSTGDSVNVYDLEKGGTVIGTGSVTTGKTDLTLTITQIGSVAGYVYVTVTSTNKRESTRTAMAYSAEGLSTAPAAANITVTNNANSNDLVIVNGLAAGDVVAVYNAATGGTQLGTATVASAKTTCTIAIAQLGTSAGCIYVTVKSKGFFESKATAVAYAQETTSDSTSSSEVIITNNSGKSDTVVVSNRNAGDIVKVYEASTGGTALGTATVSTGKTEATVTISQLGTTAGTAYISVTASGENESGRTAVSYAAEPVSDTVNDYNVSITNNPEGKSDTIKVINLTSGDIIKAYDAKVGGSLLGTATAASTGIATITITQLSEAAGYVYLSVTGKNKTESSRSKMVYDAEAQSDTLDSNDVIIDNNVEGTDDTVEVTGVDGGDVIKIYDALDGGELLGTGTVASGKTSVIIAIEQLGEDAGSVYLTVTVEGEYESERTAVEYSAEAISTAVAASDVTITNNSTTSDTIVVSNITGGDVVTVYENAKGSTVLGTATAAEYTRYATVTIKQLGASGGTVYISITSEEKEESGRTAVTYGSETTTEGVATNNVSVTNNANNSDTVEVSGLTAGDLVKVYDQASGGTLLGKATVEDYAASVTISISQLGSTGGNIYITVTSETAAESSRAAVAYSAEAQSEAPAAEDVEVNNNVNSSDIVQVSGLSEGDKVNIYGTALAGVSLGTASVATYGSSVSITVTQLGTTAGTIYVTVTSEDELESPRTAVAYSAEAQSAALDAGQVTIVNNAGTSDTIVVSGLSKDDVIKVYDAAKVGNTLATSTVSLYGSTVSMTVTQLGTSAGSLWVTVTSSKKLESSRTEIAYAAESQTTALTTDQVTIVNNAGTADTVKVTGVVGKDVVSVYSKASGGTALGTATVGTYDSTATVSIDQLGSVSGTAYVTLTSTGYAESSRTAVAYGAEPTTAAASSSYITVTNNANASDTIKVTGLSSGDVAYVYSAASGGSLLGTATVGTYASYVTVTVSQLGSEAGNVYVSLKRSGKLESTRTTTAYAAEQTTDAPESTDVTVYNYAGISDIVEVNYLEEGDVVNVYSAETDGTLLGTSTVEDGETVAAVAISQISTGAGNIYVTATTENKLESTRTTVAYSAEVTTSEPDTNNITVYNYSTIEDTMTVTYLEEGDVIYVYDKSSSGTLIGSATAGADEDEVAITLTGLDEDGGTIYVSKKSYGEKASGRVAVAYDAQAQSDALSLSNIVVANNASGTYDTITVSYLDENAVVKIYGSSTSTTVVGKATVEAGSDEVEIAVKQLGTASGTIYLTVTSYGLSESSRIAVSYSEELTSDAISESDAVIVNNAAGTSDKITVSNLTEYDVVKAYSNSTCTTLLGSGTVAEDEDQITIKISQLGMSSGYVYITVTSSGCYESEAAKIGYDAE